jgi:fluoroquinolone transport system permease protein
MKRLLATLQCDIRLQFRNGFYYASAFVVVLWAIILTQVPGLDLAWLLPGMLLGNLVINGFYFIGGLVLLEKGEGTLAAQVVTPLRTREYLASKVITLSLLSLVENGLLVVLIYGLRFNLLWLLGGLTLATAIYALTGFIAVARYDSVNEYLFPSMFYTLAIGLPLLGYFKLIETPLFYLHPLQAALLVLQASFQPVAAWQIIYGLLYSGLWIFLFYMASRRLFLRFIVASEGAH